MTLFAMFTWINNFSNAPLIEIVSEALLTGLTATSVLMTTTGFLGFLGAFTHRKAILALYTVLTWPVLAGWITVGYIGYRNRNSADWKIKASQDWSDYGEERQVIQYKVWYLGDSNFWNSLAAVATFPSWTGHLLTNNARAWWILRQFQMVRVASLSVKEPASWMRTKIS